MYGWHVLFGGIVVYYIFTRFLRPYLERLFLAYERYKKIKEEQAYDAKYHKNPDLFSARITAQQGYAQKLQEKYDNELKEHQAKLIEIRNQGKPGFNNGAENGPFHSLRSGSDTDFLTSQQDYVDKLQKKYDEQAKEHQSKLKEKEHQRKLDLDTNGESSRTSLRSEYNPLMWSGHSSNYRAPKRSKCGGGGCGK